MDGSSYKNDHMSVPNMDGQFYSKTESIMWTDHPWQWIILQVHKLGCITAARWTDRRLNEKLLQKRTDRKKKKKKKKKNGRY